MLFLSHKSSSGLEVRLPAKFQPPERIASDVWILSRLGVGWWLWRAIIVLTQLGSAMLASWNWAWHNYFALVFMTGFIKVNFLIFFFPRLNNLLLPVHDGRHIRRSAWVPFIFKFWHFWPEKQFILSKLSSILEFSFLGVGVMLNFNSIFFFKYIVIYNIYNLYI